jgi:NADH-quinone oxidoreductase subunit L
MEASASFIPIIFAFPIAGLVINAFAGKYLGNRGAGILASTMAGLSFVVAAAAWATLGARGYEPEQVRLYDWIVAGPVRLEMGFLVDTLSVTMCLLVTGVGTLIHIYSIGYIADDPHATRFFVYLNLFIASMLVLVLGNNYALLFMGWELVGLCSYLLIGFWYDKGEGGIGNAVAAKKAFVTNRIGDFGFVLGLFLIWTVFGSLDFHDVFVQIGGNSGVTPGIFTAISLLLLVGATGKSAQIPLFVWLPDAMAGPTPVSALIHAATMVTAGVYMITRSHPIFNQAPDAMGVVALIGAATAFVAGTIAVAQFDIKRVLAFSTISQLGFMIAGVGLGAYTAGMFHLLTHAFFKALLFLGSGSVIHAMEHGHHHVHAQAHGVHADEHGAHDDEEPAAQHEEQFDAQDMRNMGGLLGRMPITGWTYIAGALALAGIVPFAGFWSKDEILGEAFSFGFGGGESHVAPWIAQVVFVLLVIAAAFTAFYMTRQVLMVFFGKPRSAAAEHAPENEASMTGPLIALAVLSLIGGALNLPAQFGEGLSGALTRWLEHTGIAGEVAPINLPVAGGALLLALLAGGLGYALYRGAFATATARDPLEAAGGLFTFLNQRWYWDHFYSAAILNPYKALARFTAEVVDLRFWKEFVHDTVIIRGFLWIAGVLSQPVDRGLVDGTIDGFAKLIGVGAQRLRPLQSGYVRNYALSVLLGVAALLVYFVFVSASAR